MALEISGTMSRFQLKLADRQCRMAELSQRCQDVITILTTACTAPGTTTHWSATPPTLLPELAAETTRPPAVEPLLPPRHRTRRRDRRRPFRSIAGIEAEAILMPYEQ